MSVAIFIVLDRETDFDPFVNGKSIAANYRKINSFCKKYGIRKIDKFVSQDASEFLDDIDLPEQEEVWFKAEEGIQWVDSIIETINKESTKFNAEEIIEDLYEYKSVFLKASTVGAKWHFEIDL